MYTPIGRKIVLAVFAVLLWTCNAPVYAGSTNHPRSIFSTANLQADGQIAAKKGAVVVLIYSREDCPYCQRVKKNNLAPLALEGKTAKGTPVVIREIEHDKKKTLIDFAGVKTTHATYSAQNGVKLVPVVAFYAPDGKSLVKPIVGALLDDFYQSYLENAIDDSAQMIKGQ